MAVQFSSFAFLADHSLPTAELASAADMTEQGAAPVASAELPACHLCHFSGCSRTSRLSMQR